MLTRDSNNEMQIVTAPRCSINEHLGVYLLSS
jgi:hypothetical protein